MQYNHAPLLPDAQPCGPAPLHPLREAVAHFFFGLPYFPSSATYHADYPTRLCDGFSGPLLQAARRFCAIDKRLTREARRMRRRTATICLPYLGRTTYHAPHGSLGTYTTRTAAFLRTIRERFPNGATAAELANCDAGLRRYLQRRDGGSYIMRYAARAALLAKYGRCADCDCGELAPCDHHLHQFGFV